MKKILAIIQKDIKLRFTSPWEWMFFIVLPLIFTFLLAGGTPSGEEETRIRLLVVDESQTQISAQIIAELEKSTAVYPALINLQDGQEQFETRRASALLIIPAGLDMAAVQAGNAEVELKQQPNNMNATIAARAVLTALRRVSGSVSAAQNAVDLVDARKPFASEAEKQAYFEQAIQLAQNIQAEAPERVEVVEGATADKVDWDPRANSSAGQLITWVFIPLFGISELMAEERRSGTLRRLLTTPTGRATFLLGTVGGQVLVAIVQMALLVTFGIFVMRLPWASAPGALALIVVTACLAAGAIGTAMGAFVKTASQANGLSIMMGMTMALLGGCWYPLELFPPFIQQIVKILPTTWAMQGMLDIVLRGRGLVDVLPEAGVLLGFAALFFTIGVLRFKYE